MVEYVIHLDYLLWLALSQIPWEKKKTLKPARIFQGQTHVFEKFFFFVSKKSYSARQVPNLEVHVHHMTKEFWIWKLLDRSDTRYWNQLKIGLGFTSFVFELQSCASGCLNSAK